MSSSLSTMNTASPVLLLALSLGVSSAYAVSPEHARAADRCEVAVADTVERTRGKTAREIEFIGAKRTIAPTPEEDLGVKGEGRYRKPDGAMVSFSYSCAYSAKTGATSGAIFRETGTIGGGDKAWEPDMLNVSPDACESAIATVLKDKYPRVGRIAFGSDTRRLRPAPNAMTSLEGQGSVERAPGMSLVPFHYRCEFEGGNGKIVRAETSG
jgi:hypothetical protein